MPQLAPGGERAHAFRLVQVLAAEHDVSLLCIGHARSDEDAMGPVASMCRLARMVVIPKRALPLQAARMAAGLVRGRPTDLVWYRSGALARALTGALAGAGFDAVHLERLVLAPYLSTVRAASRHARVSVCLHNVDSVLMRRQAEVETRLLWRLRWRLDELAWRRWERTRLRGFDRVAAVSGEDAAYLAAAGAARRIGVVPLCVDTEAMRPLPPPPAAAPARLLMVGLLQYPPNADAARFMLREILPLVREELPEVEVEIVGRRAPPDLQALARATSGVALPGFVEDLRAPYQGARALAVPLRAGSGVRQKIVEAMALGRPVVATSLGAEGLRVRHGEHLLIADGARAFADALVRVCRDEALASRLASAARAFVEAEHGLGALRSALRDLFSPGAAA